MNSNDYIATYIKNYLFDEIKLLSSIMIDGKWGSGKTHYLLNELIPSLQKEIKKDFVYITLNGVSTYVEFENRIQTAIIKVNINSEQRKNVLEIISGIDSCLEESKLKEKIVLIGSIEKVLKRYYTDKKLKDIVLILDDFERIKMDIGEAFGIINDLVEHKNVKCLIVANEKELIKQCVGYNEIKEKVISRTLHYTPNVDDFLKQLYFKTYLNKYKLENAEIIWSAITKDIKKFCDGNLRTILSSISIMNDVYEIIKTSLSNNNGINEIVLRELFLDIYRIEMWYKNGKGRFDSIIKNEKRVVLNFSEDKESKEYFHSFKFVHQIVFDGIIDAKFINESICEYIDTIGVKGEVSPLQKLKYWFKQEDYQNQEYYNELINSIEDDTADVKSYQDILKMCILLNRIGYTHLKYSNVDEIINVMKKNLTQKEYCSFEYNGLRGNLNEEELRLVKKVLEDFRFISKEAKTKRITNSLNIKLNSNEWAEMILLMVKLYKEDYQMLQGFLYLLDYSLLLERLNNASNEELCIFRDAICLIYFEGISGEIYSKDIEVARRFYADLQKLDGKGKINKTTINYISNDIQRFFPEIKQI